MTCAIAHAAIRFGSIPTGARFVGAQPRVGELPLLLYLCPVCGTTCAYPVEDAGALALLGADGRVRT
jgi:hypothetical protein